MSAGTKVWGPRLHKVSLTRIPLSGAVGRELLWEIPQLKLRLSVYHILKATTLKAVLNGRCVAWLKLYNNWMALQTPLASLLSQSRRAGQT